MTTTERKQAGLVMCSDGPWEYRWRGLEADKWRSCTTPAWNWADNEYRVKPRTVSVDQGAVVDAEANGARPLSPQVPPGA